VSVNANEGWARRVVDDCIRRSDIIVLCCSPNWTSSFTMKGLFFLLVSKAPFYSGLI
jgi:hypothetical protein